MEDNEDIFDQLKKKFRTLEKYNNLKFGDEALIKDIMKTLSDIYPELDVPKETTLSDYIKLLDIVLEKENIKI